MIELEWIVECVTQERYYYSAHGDEERQSDNLSTLEVEQALVSGRILEQYDNTGRGESCLVAGFTNTGKPVHVVCGIRKQGMIIVTVYIPGEPKFKDPYTREER